MAVWKQVVDTLGALISGRPPPPPLVKVRSARPSPVRFVSVEPMPAVPGPDEQRMIERIQANDETGRLVYSDWLETEGRPFAAEYVRAELAVQATRQLPEGEPRAQATHVAVARFRAVAMQVSAEFKALLSRPAVESCDLRFELKCPKQWSSLKLTADPKVRSCGACQQSVTFCATVAEARRLTGAGHCVAVEVCQTRRPGDLEEQVVTMGR